MAYTVVNGQFNVVYDAAHHVGVNLQVQADGSFSGNQNYQVGRQNSQVKASGRIAGNVLEAQVEGEACSPQLSPDEKLRRQRDQTLCPPSMWISEPEM